MGAKVLAVLCWLAISEASVGNVVRSKIKDNISEESARLYRNAPYGVYASAAPHGAFSFHVPAAVPSKPSHLIPVKQESIVIQNSNGFLKDSYGNKFVETPQSVAYKATFPQEFVQLQHLPAHLAQPLSVTPSYHFVQGPQQPFFGAQYRLPAFDALASPFTRYGVYAGNVKSLTPASDQQFQFATPHQDSSNTNPKVIYSTQSYNELQNEPKFQSEQKPAVHHTEHYEAPLPQQKASSTAAQTQAPTKHAVTLKHNGKESVVHLDINPSLPLLDLNLLQPLTFANPVVPQVQHYLPRINAVTYHKLPLNNIDETKKHKEFVVTKTKSYDSGLIKAKPQSIEPKKKQNKPPKKDTDVHIHYEQKTEKPSIKVKGKPNDPEYSYEINSPNYKETYNEQVVSYNKATQNDPVTYTYQKDTQKVPVTYSYSHSSKDPSQTKNVQYVKKDPLPKHLIHNLPPQHNTKHHEAPNEEPESESDDSSESSEAEDESPSYDHSQYDQHDKPVYSHTSSHQSNPSPYTYNSHPSHPQQSRPQTHSLTHSHASSHSHPSTHSHSSTHSHPSTHSHSSTHSHPSTHSHSSTHSHPSTHSQPPSHSDPPSHSHQTHPHQSHSQHLKSEHNDQNKYTPKHAYYTVSPKPQYYTHQQLTPLQEFMDNIKFFSPYANGAIRLHPNQQNQQNKQAPQYYIQQTTPHERSEGHMSSEPVVYEKSKKIIIQEETPDEMHSHQEDLSAKTVGQEENSEEDFEKTYKNAAYGFPAYDRDSAESEEEIYNPENYGVPRTGDEQAEHSQFEQYQEDGDEFPKFARLGYKDDRDKLKDNYYMDYSINKPESMTDRYQSKLNYYKMFLKQRPEKQPVHLSEDKKKQAAKYTVSPSFFDLAPRQKSGQSSQYKAAPFDYENSKDSRDSSAHASIPSLKYKGRTHFVEPQFQYGFEPIAIPRIDSELETMASNDSPESEKPGTRKKIYKENWYIKKTSTSSKPS